jgi:hypothetical protein
MATYSDWKVYVLEYWKEITADTDTTTTTIHSTAHGLVGGDFIVNTLRRTMHTNERGSRLVSSSFLNADDFRIIGSGIDDQVPGDPIYCYRWVDRTSMVKISSLNLNRKIAGLTDCQLTMITQYGSFFPTAGQRIKITCKVDNTETTQFLGFIQTIDKTRPDMGRPELFLNLQISNYSQIAVGRTIRIDYDIETPYSTIVTDMITNYLIQEGIRTGTIDTTSAVLDDDWRDDCISITEVLDRCAQSSAFQWFVDDYGDLQFIRDITVVDAEHTLEDGESFTDFNNLKETETLDGYANKIFFTGGSDGSGNPVMISGHNTQEVNSRQSLIAGTGVRGTIIRDASINEAEYHTAEAGTNTATINITSHAQYQGYIIWNLTRNAYAAISEIYSNNSFGITPSITGQTTGDQIVFFSTASEIIKQALRMQSTLPKKITFESGTIDWTPGKKLYVNLPMMNILDSYYIIDSVNIFDPAQANKGLRCTVTCNLRNGSDFSTMRNVNYYDYFKKTN